MTEETLDSLPIGGLRIYQARSGYRYSLDPVLLACFVRAGKAERIVDLGTGSGIIPLLLAHLAPDSVLTGIERQSSLLERARKNVELNGFDARIRILEGDVRAIDTIAPSGCADLVVSNPPYRTADSGRIAPDNERGQARHELAGGLAEFVSAAQWLTKFGGNFAIVYPAARVAELIACMRSAGIEPKRMRMVHANAKVPARMVLLEGRKGGKTGLQIEAPLFVYAEEGDGRQYTDEVLQMYQLSDSGDR